MAALIYAMAVLCASVAMLWRTRAEGLATTDEEQLGHLRSSVESKTVVWVSASIGLVCAVNAGRLLAAERPAGWLWVSAALALGLGEGARRIVRDRLADVEPSGEGTRWADRPRRQRVLMAGLGGWFLFTITFTNLTRGSDNAVLTGIGVVLMLLMLPAAIAFGWVAVWVFRTEPPPANRSERQRSGSPDTVEG